MDRACQTEFGDTGDDIFILEQKLNERYVRAKRTKAKLPLTPEENELVFNFRKAKKGSI